MSPQPKRFYKAAMVSSTNSLLVHCPAKLNLFLDVLNKRPDGFHNILTLFERISLADTIRLTEINNDKIVVTSSSDDIPCGQGNLVYQAADLLRRSQGIKKGVKIELKKEIPVGAGLGGGSSDAASTLMGFNKLFSLKLGKGALVSYANRIGSDVAFFVLNKRFAIGKERGGELAPVPIPNNLIFWHILFVLPIKIMTKDVYGLWDKLQNGKKSLKLTKKPHDVNILISYLKRNDVFSLNRNIYNQLSETVMNSYGLVSGLKADLLKSGLKNVHMSGSGPALFTTFKKQKEAQAAFEDMTRRFSHRCRVILTSTL